MVLEAIMICIDNSEWMRNGDYPPTRMVSQNETVNYIANHKTNSNPETTVGLLAMAGRRVEVLATPSRKLHLISKALAQVPLGTHCHFSSAVRTAQLALKNRPNKNQHPRIIVFVGSPIAEDIKKLTKLGKDLRKNSVAADVINFGSENTTNGNTEKLEAFINAVNSSANSHLVNIPAGPHVMSNMVLTSEIMVPGGGSGNAGSGSASASASAAPVSNGGAAGDFDADYEMAMRMSLEDHRQRQEQAAVAASLETAAVTTDAKSEPMDEAEDEEEEDDEDDFDEEEYARALAMSMAPQQAAAPAEAKSEPATSEAEADDDADMEALEDPDFIRSLLDGRVEEGEIDDILNKLGDSDDEKGKP